MEIPNEDTWGRYLGEIPAGDMALQAECEEATDRAPGQQTQGVQSDSTAGGNTAPTPPEPSVPLAQRLDSCPHPTHIPPVSRLLRLNGGRTLLQRSALQPTTPAAVAAAVARLVKNGAYPLYQQRLSPCLGVA